MDFNLVLDCLNVIEDTFKCDTTQENKEAMIKQMVNEIRKEINESL